MGRTFFDLEGLCSVLTFGDQADQPVAGLYIVKEVVNADLVWLTADD